MSWKPIDTAPKDGTEILVCRATNADGKPIHVEAFGIFCQVASWWSEENDGTGEWIVYMSQPLEKPVHFKPTHWMPLPAPPEVQS